MLTRSLTKSTLSEFLNRFGTSTTTNFQLLHWAKELGIKNFYYVMRNEIKTLKSLRTEFCEANKKPLYIIANYQTTSENGSHHIALYKSDKDAFFFDSYGLQPMQEIIDFLGEGIYSTFKIQPDNSKMCGTLCLYLLYKLSKGFNFFDIVLELKDYFDS
jgi:hypothetical protein